MKQATSALTHIAHVRHSLNESNRATSVSTHIEHHVADPSTRPPSRPRSRLLLGSSLLASSSLLSNARLSGDSSSSLSSSLLVLLRLGGFDATLLHCGLCGGGDSHCDGKFWEVRGEV